MPFRTSMVLLALACCGSSQNAPDPARPGLQALLKDAKTRIKEISSSQLKEWQDSAERPVLIDVREDSEWQAGHAAGAMHIGRGVLESRIETAVPGTGTRIVLYCRSGARSALAADTLQKMGYTNVFSLAGGIQGYEAAGLPMVK